MFDFDEHFSMAYLRRSKNLIDGLNRRAGDFSFVQEPQPRFVVAGAKHFREDCDQRSAILYTSGVLDEARVVD
jgi:hypothetical protein